MRHRLAQSLTDLWDCIQIARSLARSLTLNLVPVPKGVTAAACLQLSGACLVASFCLPPAWDCHGIRITPLHTSEVWSLACIIIITCHSLLAMLPRSSLPCHCCHINLVWVQDDAASGRVWWPLSRRSNPSLSTAHQFFVRGAGLEAGMGAYLRRLQPVSGAAIVTRCAHTQTGSPCLLALAQTIF